MCPSKQTNNANKKCASNQPSPHKEPRCLCEHVHGIKLLMRGCFEKEQIEIAKYIRTFLIFWEECFTAPLGKNHYALANKVGADGALRIKVPA